MSERNSDSKKEDITKSESRQVFDAAVEAGIRRLDRSGIEMSISGLIAGMNVCFGAIAAAAVAGATVASFGEKSELFAHVLGSMVFPIGFLLVVVGRSELFTENFLVPTSSVIDGKAKLSALTKLWLLTFLGNLLGALITAKMVSLEHYHGVPAVHTIFHIHDIAEFLALERDKDASFISGVFAGWLITLMTWLLVATSNILAKIAIIWCVGFLIMLNKFNHVIVNSSEIFIAMFTGSESITIHAWFVHNFVPTLFGNMVGGLVFVTLLEYLKIMRVPRW
jgi:formate/nitrite transporter FocA (FNT family)